MQILGEICAFIEARYLQLKAGNIDRLKDEYLAKLYLKDESAVFRFNNEIQTAVIRDITASGQLVLETSSGLQYLNNKEIEFII
jgi:BirA family biotin operon repressor/biotin-[acetyl-CoA-carboxylase] ligase